MDGTISDALSENTCHCITLNIPLIENATS